MAFAKNRCIEQSYGEYLCFQDADDVMYPERIQEQYAKASEFQDAIVGSYFEYESKAILQSIDECQRMQQDIIQNG